MVSFGSWVVGEVVAQPYSSKDLPGGLAKLNKRNSRKAAVSAKRVPRWIRDTSEEGEALRQRVTHTFDLWVNHASLPDIVEEIGVSIPTIYDYLRKARVMRALLLANDIQNILLEQVFSRHKIIAEMRKSIWDMRNLRVATHLSLDRLNAAAAAGFNGSVNGNNGHDEENPGPEGLVLIGMTPEMTRVELEGLRLIGEQERAIEELLGLRDRHAAAGAPKTLHSAPIMTGNIYLVDASIRPGEEILSPGGRMTILPANDPRLEDLEEDDEGDDDELEAE